MKTAYLLAFLVATISATAQPFGVAHDPASVLIIPGSTNALPAPYLTQVMNAPKTGGVTVRWSYPAEWMSRVEAWQVLRAVGTNPDTVYTLALHRPIHSQIVGKTNVVMEWINMAVTPNVIYSYRVSAVADDTLEDSPPSNVLFGTVFDATTNHPAFVR